MHAQTPSPGPLAGIRVLEFSHMVMGPSCGMVLADLGADVIKIEPATRGDNTRRLTGVAIGFFPAFNRNKRSLCLDLKTPSGLAVAQRLAANADVVLENFRPGAMDKLGLGYAALSAANARLVYCSCKGFLPGPYEHRAALDEVVQMMGGLAYMTGTPGKPMRAGSSVNDIMGGLFAVIAIMAALRERETTGQGALVQSGLFETQMVLMAQHMARAAIEGANPQPFGDPAMPKPWPVYDVFDTADEGEQVFVGVVTTTQWRAFCDAFGLDALRDDPALATMPQLAAARAINLPVIAGVFRTIPKAELMARCEVLGLPFAPIAKPMDLFSDPHLLAGGRPAAHGFDRCGKCRWAGEGDSGGPAKPSRLAAHGAAHAAAPTASAGRARRGGDARGGIVGCRDRRPGRGRHADAAPIGGGCGEIAMLANQK